MKDYDISVGTRAETPISATALFPLHDASEYTSIVELGSLTIHCDPPELRRLHDAIGARLAEIDGAAKAEVAES